MSTSRKVDLCIVGGSIAGATLAAHLGDQGFTVCLVEKRPIGVRKPCAELAHIGLLDRLRRLTGADLEDIARADLDGIEVVAGRHRLTRGFDLGKGITIDRLALESALMTRAAALGVQVLRPSRVESVVVTEREVSVGIEAGGKVIADVVVGADGASSIVARRLSRAWRREEIGATRHVRLPISPELVPCGRTTVRFELLPDMAGYSWMVPYHDGIGIGVGGLGGGVDRHFHRLLEATGRHLGSNLVEMSRGHVAGSPVPVLGPTRATSGRRFILVGDAGGFISPASGEGMSLAVSSVEAAASVLKLCFASGSFSQRRLDRYEKLWRKGSPDWQALVALREGMSGAAGLSWLDACANDGERLLLVAPLVGAPDPGGLSLALLDRLRRVRNRRSHEGSS